MTVRRKSSRGDRTPRSEKSARRQRLSPLDRPVGPRTFFGFKRKPFALSPDPKFLYRSQTHGEALDTLLEAIRHLDGLLVLTGAIGSGKTTLCRAILEQLNRNTSSAVLLDPLATREDLLKTVLVGFGAVSLRDLKRRNFQTTSRTELNFLLRDFLASLAQSGSAAIVVIDEAHNLTPALWEEIRILSDLHSDHAPVHLLLVGQPKLSDRLKQPDTAGIDQRVSVRCHLEPLSRVEVQGFIDHRIQVAQPKLTCEFSDSAFDSVFRVSAGVPRLISLLCDRALHEAATRYSTVIDADLVEAASARLGASLPTVARAQVDNFADPLGEWLTHLEHVVESTPKAPLEVGAPRTTREWTPQVPWLKRLFP
jgi:general secretion pathway protein A